MKNSHIHNSTEHRGWIRDDDKAQASQTIKVGVLLLKQAMT